MFVAIDKDTIKFGLSVKFLKCNHSCLLSLKNRLIIAIKLLVTLLQLATDNFKQDAVVVRASFRVKLLKHLLGALRGFFLRQIKRVFIQVVPLEILHKLTLVSAQRVRGHETQDATSPDEVQKVNLSRQPLISLVMDLHSFLSLLETGAFLDSTAAATHSHVVHTDILPV